MGALIFAETVFYVVVSLAIIALGILFGIVTYELVKITHNLRNISENISSASKETEDMIKEMLNRLSGSPILSLFTRKALRKAVIKKGRNNE